MLLLGVFCMVGGSLVSAAGQTGKEHAPCSSATTTADMRNCENLRYQKTEQDLNSAYKELMAKLDNEGKNKLRTAQRTWLQFRQANADFAADQVRGGTLAPLVRITVMADMTEARATELKKSMQP